MNTDPVLAVDEVEAWVGEQFRHDHAGRGAIAETLIEQGRHRGVDDVDVAAQHDHRAWGERRGRGGVDVEPQSEQLFGAVER